MSEYQYYEFRAFDRPLTEREMQEVRMFSTRAEITPTSFTNEYHWGDFRGDPWHLLSRYYDAMVYYANWGSRQLMFRVPKDLIDMSAVETYCGWDSAEFQLAGGNVILSFSSSTEDPEDWEESENWMGMLGTVRAGVMEGDLRALYLAWLGCVQMGDVGEDEMEVPIPPGLATLSGSQENLRDFLRVDQDLLEVAAERSEANVEDMAGLGPWIEALSREEKDRMLLELCEGRGTHLAAQLRRRFLANRPTHQNPGERTVGELLAAAEERRGRREEEEARRAAEKRALAQAKAAAKRAAYLSSLATRQEAVWADIERLIGTKQAKAYDEAVSLLKDLRDIAAQSGEADRFLTRLDSLRQRHAGKSSLMAKLAKVGLGTKK